MFLAVRKNAGCADAVSPEESGRPPTLLEKSQSALPGGMAAGDRAGHMCLCRAAHRTRTSCGAPGAAVFTREREKTCFCGNLFALRQLFPRRQREKGRLAEGCRFKHQRGGRRKRCFRRTENAMTGQVFVHAQQRAPARAWKAGPETVPRKGGPVVPTFPAVCSFSWPGTPTHGRRNGVSPGGIGDPRRRA